MVSSVFTVYCTQFALWAAEVWEANMHGLSKKQKNRQEQNKEAGQQIAKTSEPEKQQLKT